MNLRSAAWLLAVILLVAGVLMSCGVDCAAADCDPGCSQGCACVTGILARTTPLPELTVCGQTAIDGHLLFLRLSSSVFRPPQG